MRKQFMMLAAAAAFVTGGQVHAEEHIIKAVVTQWQPMIVFAQPGDTVRFTNMAGHDTQAMEGLVPEGATLWASKMGEEGFSVTLEKEGAYIYKCSPHISTGMVGAIVVGDPSKPDAEAMIATADTVKVGGNMVKRAIRKMSKAIEKQAAN